MNFLAMTLGSIGDFFPFLAIAEGLRQRGHRVVLASNAGYAGLARMAGFEFAALWERSNQTLDGLIAQDPARAWAVVRDQMFVPAVGPAQTCIAHYAREGQWTLLASWSVLAAIKVHDTAGLPLCRIYLSPGGLESDEDRRGDGPGLRHVGLFPDWFAAAPALAQTGFAMLGDDMVPPLTGEIETFLQGGAPPVIFTPGSFMRDAGAFFRESLAACDRLGLRAIFLTPYREQIPQSLPAHVRHFNYAPLQRLAPRAAALVHHGGIGTLAQGLKASIPQLVMPLFFDQSDNAARLAALGVGASLTPQAWRSDTIAEKLQALLQSDAVKHKCAQAATHFAKGNAVEQTCDIALSMT
ncbi:MAG TPA: nucleotide disphospho-sugar-binding domain-containing protein [Rhizomicrobium sp.]|jgi:UDP:flavonoid glycosyltransferase YjiC (YdhE family)|nr:nucleotide disphospho-sugar-binding domain-containing protein [Rhizomicrobium sp.]